MKKLFSMITMILGMAALFGQVQQKTEFLKVEAAINNNITTKIIPSINSTWEYDIRLGKKLMIHQTNIPGIPGNNGFKTKEAAQKTADLVLSKIKKGEMPPSVTISEMKKLNVL